MLLIYAFINLSCHGPSFFFWVVLLLFSFTPHRQGRVWLWSPPPYSSVQIYSPAIHRWWLFRRYLVILCRILVLTSVSVIQLALLFPCVFPVLFANVNFSLCAQTSLDPSLFAFFMDLEWMSMSLSGLLWITGCVKRSLDLPLFPTLHCIYVYIFHIWSRL